MQNFVLFTATLLKINVHIEYNVGTDIVVGATCRQNGQPWQT